MQHTDTSVTTKKKSNVTSRSLLILFLFLFLLGWGTSGLNAYVLNPERQKELSKWISKAVNLENKLMQVIRQKHNDSLSFETDLIAQKRQILALENKKDAIKTYDAPKPEIKIKYVKEPIDSMLIYSIIYEKNIREAIKKQGEIQVKELK